MIDSSVYSYACSLLFLEANLHFTIDVFLQARFRNVVFPHQSNHDTCILHMYERSFLEEF